MAKKKHKAEGFNYPGKQLLDEATRKARGGPRYDANGKIITGRKKRDRSGWGQITCILRKETITALKEGGGGNYYGEYLQWWLDLHPLPPRDYYEAALAGRAYYTKPNGVRVYIQYPKTTAQERKRQKLDKALAEDPGLKDVIDEVVTKIKAKRAKAAKT